jgi:hypothetical protein
MRLWTLIFTSSILAECRRWSWRTFVDSPGCWPGFCIGVWRGLRWCGLQQRHQADDHSVLEDSSMACKEVALVAETKSWMPSNPRNHCQQPRRERTKKLSYMERNRRMQSTFLLSGDHEAFRPPFCSWVQGRTMLSSSQIRNLLAFLLSLRLVQKTFILLSLCPVESKVLITCWETKVWNEMEWKQMNWIDWWGGGPWIYTQGKGV